MAQVVKTIAEPIIEQRAQMIVDGLKKIDDLEDELKKMKPDLIQYPVDDDNKPLILQAPAMFSQEQFKKRTEMEKKLNKLYEAFKKAIPGDNSVPDYDLLEKETGKK